MGAALSGARRERRGSGGHQEQLMAASHGGAAAAAAHPATFTFWIGVAFSVNYIMGCGFLGERASAGTLA